MNIKKYNYIKKIRFTKDVCKSLIAFGVLLFFLVINANKPSDFNSLTEYYLAIFTPILMIIVLIHYLGSWSDLEITDEGIFLEYLWKKLFIPWNGIVSVIHVGSKVFGVTLVVVKKQYLTPFHRIYSLYTTGSIQPGFHIHPHFLQSNDLIKLIEKKIRSG